MRCSTIGGIAFGIRGWRRSRGVGDHEKWTLLIAKSEQLPDRAGAVGLVMQGGSPAKVWVVTAHAPARGPRRAVWRNIDGTESPVSAGVVGHRPGPRVRSEPYHRL